MRVIAHYAGRPVLELVPVKPLIKILISCLIAALITLAISQLLLLNKFILIVLCAVFFCVIYYGICWVAKLSYKEIASGLLPNFCKPIIKYLP